MRDETPAGVFETNRIEAFSDGVIAIVITLLVLDFKLPVLAGPVEDRTLLAALVAQLPQLLSWVLSFAFVLLYWVNHHGLFTQIAHADRGLLWINGASLLFLCFLPFPTAVLGQYPQVTTATVLFGLSLTSISASFVVLRWYASFRAGLLRREISLPARRLAMTRSIAGAALYALATLVAVIEHRIAVALYLLVSLLYVIPLESRRR